MKTLSDYSEYQKRNMTKEERRRLISIGFIKYWLKGDWK